jgi:hypothetical protein
MRSRRFAGIWGRGVLPGGKVPENYQLSEEAGKSLAASGQERQSGGSIFLLIPNGVTS